MKTRNGFVSNSSSSSFLILGKERMKEVSESLKNLAFFKVKDLVEIFGNLTLNDLENFDSSRKDIPEYMASDSYDCHNLVDYFYDLKFVLSINFNFNQDEIYITDAVDRDWAYERPALMDLPVFKGDL